MNKIIVVGHQPQYLPFIGILNKISKSNIYIVVDHVQYVRKYFHNRTYLKVNNQAQLLTIPVQSKGNYLAPINEIKISNDEPWRKKHLKSIQIGYSKAPYFKAYYDEISAIYDSSHEYLSQLTSELLLFFLKEFEVVDDIRFSSDMNITGQKTELLIQLTQAVGGTMYISGEGAKNYFDAEVFEQSGLQHIFNKFQHPEYPQQGKKFIPGMGCLDLLFNCGKDGRKYIIQDV